MKDLNKIHRKWDAEENRCDWLIMEDKEEMEHLHIHCKMRENSLFDQVIIFPDEKDYPHKRTIKKWDKTKHY